MTLVESAPSSQPVVRIRKRRIKREGVKPSAVIRHRSHTVVARAESRCAGAVEIAAGLRMRRKNSHAQSLLGAEARQSFASFGGQGAMEIGGIDVSPS